MTVVGGDGRTPEFVRWTIGRPCPLREEYDWTDPEQTERLLRPLREAGEALQDGRVVRNIAFEDPPPIADAIENVRGFDLAETLRVFGGAEHVAACCGECPANVHSAEHEHWAGCYGMFYLADAAKFQAALEKPVGDTEKTQASWAQAFRADVQPWYACWLDASFSDEQAKLVLSVLNRVNELTPGAAPGLSDFLRGLRVAVESGLPMYARLIPAGRLLGSGWKLDPHCKRCRAPRNSSVGDCPVCRARGEYCAGRTRKVQGERPYVALVRLLGAAKVANLIAEYNAASRPPG